MSEGTWNACAIPFDPVPTSTVALFVRCGPLWQLVHSSAALSMDGNRRGDHHAGGEVKSRRPFAGAPAARRLPARTSERIAIDAPLAPSPPPPIEHPTDGAAPGVTSGFAHVPLLKQTSPAAQSAFDTHREPVHAPITHVPPFSHGVPSGFT